LSLVDVGQVYSTVVNSVLDSSKLSLGTLKLDVYFGEVSLFNKLLSKSSKFKKNSSLTPLFGLIKMFSLYVVAPLNGLPLTVSLISFEEFGSVYDVIS